MLAALVRSGNGIPVLAGVAEQKSSAGPGRALRRARCVKIGLPGWRTNDPSHRRKHYYLPFLPVPANPLSQIPLKVLFELTPSKGPRALHTEDPSYKDTVRCGALG